MSANCIDYKTLTTKHNGSVIENNDGTGVKSPFILSKACCEYLGNNYFFDIENQKCRWSSPATCNIQNTFKLVLNPNGNDGSIFYVENGDSCSLSVDFDYLFKIKCETLNEIINKNTTTSNQPIDPILQAEINDLQNQLDNKTKLCDSYTSQITEFNEAFNNTLYSIVCNSIPQESTVDGPYIVTAGSTAFGNVAPFSFYKFDFDLTPGQIYCITEPDGLNEWRKILGEVRYANFINGDLTSYTCADVQALFSLNTTILNDNIFNGSNRQELMVACNTP